jgi:hypothetical protein
MPPRYIRASELGSFVFCRRAWFLERQHQPTAPTQTGTIGAVDHVNPARAGQQVSAAARLSALLLLLGFAGFACAAVLTWVRQ